ncbi:MAG TPA: WXG100 family type VII secretion target [Actinocrinis sp.]|nr:WXG100 family type VII secretion target [Actinocrinis sp.]
MGVELPGEVAWFLNLIGVPSPNVDEDQVRLFAQHVRTFAQNVDETHQVASSTIRQMSSAYQGSSYEQLVASWARMSNDHMCELVDACHIVATAVDVAADAIVAAKVAALGELAALVASFVADQAAAVVTFGAAEAAEALIVEGAKKLINGLINQLEQHILGEVIANAVEPLEQVVHRAVRGLVFEGAASAGGAVGSGFGIVPGDLIGYAQHLAGHADEVAGHARTFGAALAGVNFGE